MFPLNSLAQLFLLNCLLGELGLVEQSNGRDASLIGDCMS